MPKHLDNGKVLVTFTPQFIVSLRDEVVEAYNSTLGVEVSGMDIVKELCVVLVLSRLLGTEAPDAELDLLACLEDLHMHAVQPQGSA